MHDPLGQAALDFHHFRKADEIQVVSRNGDQDTLPVHYLFRAYEDMPDLEQEALHRSTGKVVEFGSGVGSHLLYLQKKGIDAHGYEISPGACKVMEMRGVENIIHSDFKAFNQKADTLLMMMNGIGLVGDISGLKWFLRQAKTWLYPNGKILFDSCDVAYVYDRLPLPDQGYYGEIEFQMTYKNQAGPWFKWLYIDPVLLEWEANKLGWDFTLLKEDETFQYLGELRLKL